MVGSTAGCVAGRPSPALVRRSSRLVRPTEKRAVVSRPGDQEVRNEGRPASKRVRRASSTESDSESTAGDGAESAAALLRKVLDELQDLKEASSKQQELIGKLEKEVVETKEELKRVTQQLENATRSVTTPSSSDCYRQTYADAARTPPESPKSSNTRLASDATVSNASELLFCTIDVSRVPADDCDRTSPGAIRTTVENEIRTVLETPAWRCRAVTRDVKAPHRIRIICRDENELQRIKGIAEKNLPPGTRVLRDEYYPIKIDGVSRSAILDEQGKELSGLNEALGSENGTEVTRVTWLSHRFLKPIGSVVVYLKRASDAARFLREEYFYAAEAAGGFTHLTMSKPLRVIQLNVHKGDAAHHSLMNDEDTQDAAVILIQEPRAWKAKEQLFTAPMVHHKWTRVVPSITRDAGRWPIRSMLWVRKDLEAEQVPIESPDLTAVLVRLPDRHILFVSVYVEGGDAHALAETCGRLRKVVREVRGRAGNVVDVVIAGDFNRHDQLWGGDEVSWLRQGEGDDIINLMHDLALSSLLPRGTKTWQGGEYESTIDLTLASGDLAANMIKAKPSSVAKRWWTEDLTQLRRIYTHWRNKARSARRAGCRARALEDAAKAAAKQYHDAIRQQKKSHWNEFLADNDNIWQIAKYLKSGQDAAFGRVPQLRKTDGSYTTSDKDRAQELLTSFFPPLPDAIEEETSRPLAAAVPMPELTMEEIERQLNTAKDWKAPGDDGLPVAVWKQVWPVVKNRVFTLFQASLRDGTLPSQWLHAKIIPLKKPGKEDYTTANAWRPISLLATLGKMLESVIAERLSYVVEVYGLLPTNHFGARKKRSAEQALMVMQEYIYAAWRRQYVVSAVSFDVKGAYNGVCKERLLQRLKARRIPDGLIRWVDTFCSNRTASIQVNGYTSEVQGLPQAGLPQGSPLSPILYLFFNADLVQRHIDANGGAIAFVDDFTAWVAGPTALLNHQKIQSIIDDALAWERRSGATFDNKKTAIIHFTKTARKLNTDPFIMKDQIIYPKDCVKILGLIMDTRLKYKPQIARVASKGLATALELTRFKGLTAATARRLFSAMVAPAVDYASNIWMHAYKDRNVGPINRVQRVGVQAIVGTFLTVATSIAETEASIPSAGERFWKRAIKMWIDIHTLPETNPLRRITSRIQKHYFGAYRSPFHQVALRLKNIPLQEVETILPFTLAPWEQRIEMIKYEKVNKTTEMGWDIRIAVSSSARNDVLGGGGAVEVQANSDGAAQRSTFLLTLGWSHRHVALLTTNQAVALTLRNPRQHSGQGHVRSIYNNFNRLWKNENSILVVWIPSSDQNKALKSAKREARQATKQGATPRRQVPIMKSTTLNLERKKIEAERSLPDRTEQLAVQNQGSTIDAV
ncbi:hypothetical protein NLG97_g6342 [Lecanicillium saksenae]|uniref:Uncharacterized protein n=1 Tax=Lecanicillium saksenae TaxID=468837 RepID=A0ACC1QQH5_9HYPO|nr:hypothetical protein NLG97_g6342 [Lecanicillium saksenae]